MRHYGPDSSHQAVIVDRVAEPEFGMLHQVGFWGRVTFVLLIAGLAFHPLLVTTVRDATAGSQTAYLLTAPVLAGLIAVGYLRPAQGVTDSESDWIIALITVVLTAMAIGFTTHRLPTLAAFWRLENIGPVAAVAASATIVFTVRETFRMWSVWLFALFTALVPFYLLTTAYLGGSDIAVVRAAAALGAVAVFLASRFARWYHRIAMTAADLALAAAADRLVIAVWVDAHLLIRVVVASAVAPVLATLVLHLFSRRTGARRPAMERNGFPHRRPWSYLALLVISGLMLWHSPPVRSWSPAPEARPDWMTALHLQPATRFPFITRFLGTGAQLIRYLPEPGVAVDVMTAPRRARIADYADAVWYPVESPVNYRTVTIDGFVHVPARSLHSNADFAVTAAPTQWFALTWVWHAGDAYQQVTVVVNQYGPDHAPPEPEPITWRSTILRPAKWLVRHRPTGDGLIEPTVSTTATRIATRILTAAAPR